MTTEQQQHGQWHAVLTGRYGEVLAIDSLLCADDIDEDTEITIVRDTAAPKDGRMPHTFTSSDLIATWDYFDFDDEDQMRVRWEQARAMVAGLNAAAETAGVAR